MVLPKKRSLLHIVGYAAHGGCERCCEVFIRYSPEFAHRVVVLGEPGPMSEVWGSSGAEVTHLDLLREGWFGFQAGLQAGLRQRSFGAVIVWAGIRVPIVFAALRPFRRPVVLHAGNPFAGEMRVRLLLHVGQLLQPPSYAAVMACSEHVARTFRRAPYYGRLRVESCLNPIDVPAVNPHQARVLAPAERVRIGMVARLDAIKDQAALLAAFACLRRDWPKAELHLAGEGPRRPALEAQARESGLAGAVCFHGSVADVPGFLRTLDLFAYFTTAQEGMGIALAEAMAAGLPCVVSDLPVMREVSGDGAAAAVRYAPADPEAAATVIRSVLVDVEGRALLSARAHARAEQVFRPRPVVERYLKLLGVAA